MKFQKKTILVTVKAYPNPSKKHGETVCCAGIDLETNKWIRLYPIPFRDLDGTQKFKKYSIINVECTQASDDKRPESFCVRANTIDVVDWLDTDGGSWERRKSLVFQLPHKSMCQVLRDQKETDLSLGLIKPKEISFICEKQRLSDQKSREACYSQLSFFNKTKDAIEEIPFAFYYVFKCRDEEICEGHKLSIIDWEIGQAYRNWHVKYSKEEELLERIKQQWLDIVDITRKDVYFYVGNMKRFRNNFMILGVFYPRISSS